jgi:hypothetical protein
VDRLHRCDDAERREALELVSAHELHVLDLLAKLGCDRSRRAIASSATCTARSPIAWIATAMPPAAARATSCVSVSGSIVRMPRIASAGIRLVQRRGL